MLLLDSWRNPEIYEWWFARTPLGRAPRAVEQAAILRLPGQVARPHDAVLEYGPGTGAYTVDVARRVRRMRALEPSDAMADYLRGRLEREGISNVVVERGMLPNQLGQERGADGVVAVGVLDYLPDLAAALHALASVLHPGGWLLATNPARTRGGRLAALKGRGRGTGVHVGPPRAPHRGREYRAADRERDAGWRAVGPSDPGLARSASRGRGELTDAAPER